MRDKIIGAALMLITAVLALWAAFAKMDRDREALMPIIMREEAEQAPEEKETDAREIVYQKLAEYAARAEAVEQTLPELPTETETAPETTAETTTEAQTPCQTHENAPKTPETDLATQIYTEKQNEPQTAAIYGFSEEDRTYLVKVASCEAGNQGVYGMALVMRVVLNRAATYGASIHDVLYAPEQFDCVYGDWWASGFIADGVYDALAMVESGWDESYGALYFCTPAHNGWHSSHLTYLFQYGNHQFYR